MSGRTAEMAPDVAAPADGSSRREVLAYRSLRAVEWLGMHLPRRAGLVAAEATGRALFRRWDGQRRTVAQNLGRVLGHPPESSLVQMATLECFTLYARYWYETFALRSMPIEEVNRRFTIEGLEHIDAAVAAGGGIVIALPHMGNWDAAGHWLAVNGYRMTAVAEELKPVSVFDLFYRHRRALGMNIVPLSGGRKSGEALVRLLGENHILTLVADRDLTSRGVQVEMFGARRLIPAGPAYLSLLTGAPLSVAAVFTTDKGWHCFIGPNVEIERTGDMRQDVTAMTNLVAMAFERHIAASPTDWHMFQPAWD